MIIEHNKIEEFFVVLRGSWNDGVRMANLWYPQVATREESTSETNRYWWTEDMGELQTWVGPREFSAIHARTWDVTNEKFQRSYKVDADHMMDAQVNIYTSLARGLGRAATLWPQTLLKPWITEGHLRTCYDGQPFFDESHPVSISDSSMGVQSNYFRTNPFNPTNWAKVSKRMKTFKNSAGQFYGIRPTYVLHAPDIETEVRQLFNSTYIAAASGINPSGGTATNIHAAEAIPVMIPELPDGWWIAVDTSQPVKPFVYQVRQDPVFIAQTDPTGTRYFSEHEYAFGVDARGKGTGTLPVLAVLSRPD